MRTAGQTDMTKTMPAFRKVTEVPNRKRNIFDATNDSNRSKQAQENGTYYNQNFK
jgi:hypothetical protein